MSAAAALRKFTLPELCAYTTLCHERIRVIVNSRPDLFSKTGQRAGSADIWQVADQEKLLAELGDAE